MKEFTVFYILNPHCAILLHIQNISSSWRPGCKTQSGISSSVQCVMDQIKERNKQELEKGSADSRTYNGTRREKGKDLKHNYRNVSVFIGLKEIHKRKESVAQ